MDVIGHYDDIRRSLDEERRKGVADKIQVLCEDAPEALLWIVYGLLSNPNDTYGFINTLKRLLK